MLVQSMPYPASAGEITLVGSTSATIPGSTGSNTAVDLTALTGGIGSAPIAGDIVIVGYGANNDNAAFDVQMITAGYTEQADLQSPSNVFDSHLGVFTKIMGGSPDSSCTVGPTGSGGDDGVVAVSVWRGVNATPMDVAVQTGGNSGAGLTRPNPGPITPVTAGAVIVVVGHGAKSSNFTTLGDLANTVVKTTTFGGTIGIGSKNWTGGAYDCAEFSGGSADGQYGNTWCVMALRPA